VRTELRKLIERVDFIPLQGLGKFQLEVHGSLAALLALGQARNAKKPHGQEPWGFCRSESHIRV
jgi:hypothetical protein